MSNILVFCNNKQIEFLNAKQRVKFALCGRGFGKSHLIGEQLIDMIKMLPGAKIALVGMTYLHIQTKTLAPVKQCWASYGMYNYDNGEGEFCSFVKPPKSWIKNMIAPPDKWSYIISFPNGTHIELVSWADIDRTRGSSFDAMLIDEAALLSNDDLTQVLLPTVRGNIHRFKDNRLHQSICLFTSIPWLPSGQWVYTFEELSKTKPEKYFWLEGNAKDNIDVLGEQWITDQKEMLPDIKFRVEIMNERISKLPDSFYHKFSEGTHTLSIKDIARYYIENNIDSTQITEIEKIKDHRTLYETLQVFGATAYCINPNEGIDVTFDFNAALNTIIVGQMNKSNNTYIFYNEMYVKYKSYLELVDWFCKLYHTHTTKYVHIYGDRNGNKRDASNVPSYYEDILKRFKYNGWQTYHHSTGAVEQLHTLRHSVINNILAESNPRLPKVRILIDRCPNTILSIINTPVLDNFKKDKSSEKNMKDNREQATDFGDAFDYLVYDKFASLLGYNSKPLPLQFR